MTQSSPESVFSSGRVPDAGLETDVAKQEEAAGSVHRQHPEGGAPDICAQLVDFRSAVAAADFGSAADLLCDVIGPAGQNDGILQQCLDALLDAPVDDQFAEATLLRLLEVEPNCAAAQLRLAALDIRHERHGRALEWLGRAEACGPLPQTANLLRIEALLNATDWGDTFSRSLERALLVTPHARRLYGLKCDFHGKHGEQEDARAALALAMERFPEDPWFALRSFRQRLADKDLEGAALLFSERIWRSSMPEQTRRGALGMLTREWAAPETLETFLNGLLCDAADDRFVLVKLASLATRQRRHYEAVRHIERAERHGALPAEAESMRVNMLILGGDAKASLALAKQLLAARPDRNRLCRRPPWPDACRRAGAARLSRHLVRRPYPGQRPGRLP